MGLPVDFKSLRFYPPPRNGFDVDSRGTVTGTMTRTETRTVTRTVAETETRSFGSFKKWIKD